MEKIWQKPWLLWNRNLSFRVIVLIQFELLDRIEVTKSIAWHWYLSPFERKRFFFVFEIKKQQQKRTVNKQWPRYFLEIEKIDNTNTIDRLICVLGVRCLVALRSSFTLSFILVSKLHFYNYNHQQVTI